MKCECGCGKVGGKNGYAKGHSPETRERLRSAHSAPERRAATSMTVKKSWEDPKIKARRLAGIHAALARPEVMAGRSRVQKERWKKPGSRERMSALMKEVMNRPDVAGRVKEAQNRPDVRKRRSESMKRAMNKPEVKAKLRENIGRPEVRSKLNEGIRLVSKDPTVRAKHSAAYRSQRGRPSKTELTLWKALDPNKYKYAGTGKWQHGQPISSDIVCPDLRWIILVHGCFWHACPKHGNPKYHQNRPERDKQKLRHARSKGWQVTVVWEHEILSDLSGVVRRIQKLEARFQKSEQSLDTQNPNV